MKEFQRQLLNDSAIGKTCVSRTALKAGLEFNRGLVQKKLRIIMQILDLELRIRDATIDGHSEMCSCLQYTKIYATKCDYS